MGTVCKKTITKVLTAGGEQRERIAAKTTGSDDSALSPLAPTLAPTSAKPRILRSIPDKTAGESEPQHRGQGIAASACVVKRKDPLTTAVNGPFEWAAPDSNWRPLPCEARFLITPKNLKVVSTKEFTRFAQCCKPLQTMTKNRGKSG